MTGRQVRLERAGDIVVARLEGEVDLRSVAAVSADLSDAIGNDILGLVIDLAATRYIDSVGIHMLFSVKRHLDVSRQGMAILLDDESPIRNLIKITNLDEVVDVRPTLDECVAAIEARAGQAY